MAVLTTKRRKALKTKVFGLPKERKYPMPDKAHAVNAKARAEQQYAKGNLSKAQKDQIDRMANKKLYGKSSLDVPKDAKTGIKLGREKKEKREYDMKFKGRKVRVKRGES